MLDAALRGLALAPQGSLGWLVAKGAAPQLLSPLLQLLAHHSVRVQWQAARLTGAVRNKL